MGNALPAAMIESDDNDMEQEGDELELGEIPPESWVDFLDVVARKYEGWIVDVTWPGTDPEDFTPYGEELSDEYLEYRLEGIESDLDNGDGRISVQLSGDRRIVLDRPERVEVLEASEISDELLEIEASGVTCQLHLRAPKLEEDLEDDTSFPSEQVGLGGDEDLRPVEEDLSILR
jgi:hypothetical protein